MKLYLLNIQAPTIFNETSSNCVHNVKVHIIRSSTCLSICMCVYVRDCSRYYIESGNSSRTSWDQWLLLWCCAHLSNEYNCVVCQWRYVTSCRKCTRIRMSLCLVVFDAFACSTCMACTFHICSSTLQNTKWVVHWEANVSFTLLCVSKETCKDSGGKGKCRNRNVRK